MTAILLAGLVAFLQLPVSALPEVDYPTIQVVTFYPGASPTVMSSAVTAPLERQFGQVPGLNQMTSHQFRWQLHHRLAGFRSISISTSPSRRSGPPSTPPRAISRQESSHAAHLQQDQSGRHIPIPTLALTSNTLPLSQVEDLAFDTRLFSAKSFPAARRWIGKHHSGGQKPAIRVQVNPNAALRLRHQPGRRAHRAAIHQPSTSPRAISMARARGLSCGSTPTTQILTSKDFQSVVVAYHNGAPVSAL